MKAPSEPVRRTRVRPAIRGHAQLMRFERTWTRGAVSMFPRTMKRSADAPQPVHHRSELCRNRREANGLLGKCPTFGTALCNKHCVTLLVNRSSSGDLPIRRARVRYRPGRAAPIRRQQSRECSSYRARYRQALTGHWIWTCPNASDTLETMLMLRQVAGG